MKLEKVNVPEQVTLNDSVLFEGDALHVLRKLPSESVQCVVT